MDPDSVNFNEFEIMFIKIYLIRLGSEYIKKLGML